MKILLVDDDVRLAQTLAQHLATQLYTVDTATDGESGWNCAQADVYDLIVLDAHLPHQDGMHLSQRLRQNHYRGPILLLTAPEEHTNAALDGNSEANDAMTQSCTVEALSAQIQALLHRPPTSSHPRLESDQIGSLDACEPTPIAPTLSAERARAAAIALWEQFKHPSLERLAVLDQAVIALQSGSLPPDLETQARYAAHKLAGSLGMFGFPQGSQLGQQIERWFETADRRTELALLEAWVFQLHHELNQAPEASDDLDWMASLAETQAEQP